jgi:antitoxin VapB
MKTARIFNNGRSQAVRLPKEYRFKGDEVYVNKLNGIVMLIEKENPWQHLINSLELFADDFMNEREQLPQPEREDIDL